MTLFRLECANTWRQNYFLLTIFTVASILFILCILDVRFLQKDENICRTSEHFNYSKSAQLPQLPSVEFYIELLGAKSPRRGEQFDPVITKAELRATVKLFWEFFDLCEKHGIRVMIDSGTLLGSYRHHGFIPWDDDLDLLIDWADHEKLIKALNSHPDFRLKDVGLWKISLNSTCLHVDVSGCWPFIDVAFYEVQDGWILQKFGKFRCPVKYTFPLHKRPFMGRWVDSPKDSVNFLSYSIGGSLHKCKTRSYSHKFEADTNTSEQSTCCGNLALTYPFVFRVPDTAPWCRGVVETLRLPNGELAYSVLVDEPMA